MRRFRTGLCQSTQKKAKADWGVFSLEDLHQVTDIAVWQALRKFDAVGAASFHTYAYAAMRNSLTDYRRAHRRHVKRVELVDPAFMDGRRKPKSPTYATPSCKQVKIEAGRIEPR